MADLDVSLRGLRRMTPLHICTVGNSGSGKSTFARELAGRLGVPAIELDSLFHQPGWTQLPPDEFRAAVAARLAVADAEHGGWVADGNYRRYLDDITLGNAHAVVWFDFPRPRVMWQLSKRTFSRVVTKKELWNGNVERLSNLVRWSPEANILRWAWTQHDKYRETYAQMAAEAAVPWIRLGNPGERDAALRLLTDRLQPGR